MPCSHYCTAEQKHIIAPLYYQLEQLKPDFHRSVVEGLVSDKSDLWERIVKAESDLAALVSVDPFSDILAYFLIQVGTCLNKKERVSWVTAHTKLDALMKKMKTALDHISDKTREISVQGQNGAEVSTRGSSGKKLSYSLLDSAVDELIQSLDRFLAERDACLIGGEKFPLKSIDNDLKLDGIPLEIMKRKPVTQIIGIASRLKAVFAQPYVSCFRTDFSSDLNKVTEEMKAIIAVMMNIYEKGCSIRMLSPKESSSDSMSSMKRPVVMDDVVVGFDDEVRKVKNLLGRGRKQLEVVSIIGMPGLGKTTLARKVYSDPYIAYHFNIRSWTHISHSYNKREILVQIAESLFDITDEIMDKSDNNIGEMIYKRLKGQTYLIVMDDIWSVGAWNDVRIYLPNDNTGSRVLFTSRLTEVALQAKPKANLHFLRFLTEDESSELLFRKVFPNKQYPSELLEIGKLVAERCNGLPLSIVVIAGLLAKSEKEEERWKYVAQGVSSGHFSDTNPYMDTLALSYEHLPQHLKLCFLYLGAFRGDREIPVWELILLWVAEGFIQQTGGRRLEEISEDYLMDLIDRNLVIVARKRSDGGIKSCHLHDLIRDLCLRKADEFNFLERSSACLSSSNPAKCCHSLTRNKNSLRLSIHCDFGNFDYTCEENFVPIFQSLLCFGSFDHTPSHFNPTLRHTFAKASEFSGSKDDMKEREKPRLVNKCFLLYGGFSFLRGTHPSMLQSHFVDEQCSEHAYISEIKSLLASWSLILRSFKLLRVLVLWCPNVLFSREVLQLFHLRYLAIQSDDCYVLPASISNILNLQTLILGTRSSNVIIPYSVREMLKLRHLKSKGGKFHIDLCPPPDVITEYSSKLENLQTISDLCPCGSVQNFLAMTPNLRKLGFRGYMMSELGCLKFPDLSSLRSLESLKLDNTSSLLQSSNLENVIFPATLKCLTLRSTKIEWGEMSAIAMLPNLEVLKLETHACHGPQWETSDGGFLRLKFLKFKCLAIERWFTSSTHLPVLEHLVFESCILLEEVPFDYRGFTHPANDRVEVFFTLHR